ncbi:MAG: hypothetical protein D6761_08500 [Candidatus Dadabacteria bacterium]|nr:MAG: hypothetical protein D6761_08500 [Candidatus Dadabacteria bacterium]
MVESSNRFVMALMTLALAMATPGWSAPVQDGGTAGDHSGHDMDHMGRSGKMMHRLEAGDGNLHGKLEPQGELATGQKQKLLLRLTDEHGKPVRAKSVKFVWSMPSMGHDMGTKYALPQKEAGVWRVNYNFPMAGHYRAEAIVKLSDDSQRTLVFELMIP